MFEILEYTLEHQLPNFSECWWDHVSKITTQWLLYLSILLQLISEFIFSCLLSIMQQYQDLRFVTTLHVLAYSGIIVNSDHSSVEGMAAPPEFQHTDDGRVG
jgi:hypothetical protein